MTTIQRFKKAQVLARELAPKYPNRGDLEEAVMVELTAFDPEISSEDLESQTDAAVALVLTQRGYFKAD